MDGFNLNFETQKLQNHLRYTALIRPGGPENLGGKNSSKFESMQYVLKSNIQKV